MNSFSISLGPVDDRQQPTGGHVCFRSGDSGFVEIVVVRHKPGPKGGSKVEESHGQVHMSDLYRVLGAVAALMGGCRE